MYHPRLFHKFKPLLTGFRPKLPPLWAIKIKLVKSIHYNHFHLLTKDLNYFSNPPNVSEDTCTV